MGRATPERFSRRGFGRALLAAVLEDAFADGATTGLLGATPAGLPLYEATGWRHLEEWQIFTNAVLYGVAIVLVLSAHLSH